LLKAAALAALSPSVTAWHRRVRLDRIGVQLYTLRDLMQVSVQQTLEQVAAVGCRSVEFAGYFNTPPRRLRRWLDDAGLTAPAAHLPLDDPAQDLTAILDAAAVLGHSYLVLASLSLQQRATIGGFRIAAERLNRIGELAKPYNMRAAYHNHDFEFVRIAGMHPYTVMLEETDPDLVAMEVDVYWMVRAGEDPLAYFEKYPGRFHLCHLKDMDGLRRITEVGSGGIDFPGILAARRTAGLRHFFIEHDDPQHPIQSVRSSYDYLTRLR
jgi:sugar phosphate isomerase/epimerase